MSEVDWLAVAKQAAESQAETVHMLLKLKPHGDEWELEGHHVRTKDVSINTFSWKVSWLDLAPVGQERRLETVKLDVASIGAVVSIATALRNLVREFEEGEG